MCRRSHAFVVLASFVCSLASGCWLDPEESQSEEDALELPSQPLPLEGSSAAYGMLRVVNERGLGGLDEDVGLDRQAASSIIAHRAGSDGIAGGDRRGG